MIYKWRGISLGVIFSRGGIFTGDNFLAGKILGGNFHREELDKKSGTSKNKKENYNPAHKMVEKFRKSWVLSICLIELVTLLTNSILAHSFTPGRLPRSFIIVCLIAPKYFCH